MRDPPARLVFELIGQAKAATRIILWCHALGSRGAVAPLSLQLQVFCEIDVDLYLARAGGAFLDPDIHPAGNIAPSRNAFSRAR